MTLCGLVHKNVKSVCGVAHLTCWWPAPGSMQNGIQSSEGYCPCISHEITMPLGMQRLKFTKKKDGKLRRTHWRLLTVQGGCRKYIINDSSKVICHTGHLPLCCAGISLQIQTSLAALILLQNFSSQTNVGLLYSYFCGYRQYMT